MKLRVAACVLLLSGCSSPPAVPHPTVSDVADASVVVTDAEVLVLETMARYVAVTNQIVHGGDPSAIAEVTTDEWALTEAQGFAALEALGGEAPDTELAKVELTSVRGRTILVDAIASACLGAGDTLTRVSVHLVPRRGSLVIADVIPWEDSTWCAASPLL